MRDEPREIETPKRRVFMPDVLKGIPRETYRMGDVRYLLPLLDAVREEEQTVTAGLTNHEDKKRCHEMYRDLNSLLAQARELLIDACRDADVDGLTGRGKTVLLSAQLYFDKAAHAARKIEKAYQRISDPHEHVDKTIGGGGGPAPYHSFDKKF